MFLLFCCDSTVNFEFFGDPSLKYVSLELLKAGFFRILICHLANCNFTSLSHRSVHDKLLKVKKQRQDSPIGPGLLWRLRCPFDFCKVECDIKAWQGHWLVDMGHSCPSVRFTSKGNCPGVMKILLLGLSTFIRQADLIRWSWGQRVNFLKRINPCLDLEGLY